MYYNAADLKKYIVDWWLDLEAKCVRGIFLVESKLVIDAEVRQGGDRGLVLWRHLVTISLHIQPLSQLFQLLPTTFITSSPLHLFHCSENDVPQRLMNSNDSFSISTNTSLNTSLLHFAGIIDDTKCIVYCACVCLCVCVSVCVCVCQSVCPRPYAHTIARTRM